MKSLNFKRKENSQLRYIEEKVTGKAKPRFNWDRAVYLSVLSLLVFFVLRYFFLNNFYIEADGQMIFDNVEVSHTEDMRIEKFYVNEGDNIKIGDTLFKYSIENTVYESEILDLKGSPEPKSNWADREMYSLQKSIDLNNSQIRSDKSLITTYKSELSKMRNEVILGTASERDLNNLEYQITKLETSINLSKSENSVLHKQLIDLKKGIQLDSDTLTEVETLVSPFRSYISPIDGYIARIYKEPYEVALKSQIILKIHQADSVHIKGYFDQEDLRYVKVGDEVDVSFPDGQESIGIISRFYSATVMIPEEFQKKFEPAKRTIAVDILPAEGSNLALWKRYYKLSVKLSKRTF